ncbi:MAG: class I SAM-dependent methyltransferase [Gammaproteobacteria bacterium]|nr:class I SAM-dependent methyltransferase [Gammaproteobacteria bacterium]
MKRGYQYRFSELLPASQEVFGRERKAQTMVAVLGDFLELPLAEARVLDVGGSGGAIDNALANHFGSVIGVDIDEPAIARARIQYHKPNLEYRVGDALNLDFAANSFEVVICSHVYEHVPDAQRMMDEILRVLVPGGVCYFAAGNRFMWKEPPLQPALTVGDAASAGAFLYETSEQRDALSRVAFQLLGTAQIDACLHLARLHPETDP